MRVEPLLPAHAALLFPILADARLYTLVPESPYASEMALADRFARLARGAPANTDETWLNWALLRCDMRQAVGTLQATVTAAGRVYIGYVIDPARWGEGYATEACRWLLATLPRRVFITEFIATVDVRNARSIRVLERLGFVRIGVEAAQLHGAPTTDYRYRRAMEPATADA
jgi:RimJ/RimL family protein N-acetyltransferase